MRNLNDYKRLLRSTIDINSIEFSEIIPGSFYELIQFKDDKLQSRYIKIIHILRNGSDQLETLDGNRPVGKLASTPGIWYLLFNLDTARQTLTPVVYKSKGYKFEHQLDYGLHWSLRKLPKEINTL